MEPVALQGSSGEDGADPRRHVGRGRFLGGGRPRLSAGARGGRGHHEAVGRPLRLGLLLGGRCRRRPPGGPATRHRPPRVQLLATSSTGRWWALRRRPRRPVARRTRASSATGTSSSTASSPGRPAGLRRGGHRPSRPGRSQAGDGAGALRRGIDTAKDQSYVLHMLGQAQLARVRASRSAS